MKRFAAIACLVIGPTAALGVAWSCALWSPLTRYAFLDPPPPAGSRLGLRLRLPADWTIRTCLVRRGPGLRHDTVSECEWLGSALGAGPSTAPNRTVIVVSCGWPLAAMQWTEHDARRATLGPFRAGIDLAGTGVPRRDYPQPRLPLRPLWPGLAIDAALFAAAAIASSSGLAGFRRRRRRRRHRCARCGYPVAGLGACPECGTPTA